MPTRDSLWTRIKIEWWFHVTRKCHADYWWLKLAHWMPRRLAYFAFFRVCGATEGGFSSDGEWNQILNAWAARYPTDRQ